MRILVVDNDALLRGMLAQFLTDEGHTVCCAAHGAEAVRRLIAEPNIALLLLDMRMPVMDGPAVCEWIARHLPIAARPTILAMSATPQLAQGAPGVALTLAKPFGIDDLQGAVARIAATAPRQNPQVPAA